MVLAVPFLVIFVALVGLSFMAMTPGFSAGMSAALKDILGPLGYAISWGLSATVKMTRYLTRHVGEQILNSSALAVGWLAQLAKTVEYVGTMALLWPLTLTRFIVWLLEVELPRLIRALPNATTKVFHSTVTRVVRIEKTLVRFPKLSRAQAKALVAAAIGTLVVPYLPALRWLRAHFHALTAVIPHAIPLQWGRTVSGIRKRLRRLERITAAGVAVGAVAVALGKLGVGWIRCRKVGRIGRQVCGMDEGLLESLLTNSLAIFSVLSVVEFANEMRTVEDEAVKIMGRLVREFPG